MYAIALHDPAAGRLVLARDPFGIKPLYYVETAARASSSPRSRRRSSPAASSPRELVRQVRNELLQLQFTTGRETIFAGIQRVLPGETVVVTRGRIVERRRREALPAGAPLPLDEARGAGGVRPRLRRQRAGASALRRALRHVPLGRHRFLGGAGDDGAAQRAPGERLHRRLLQQRQCATSAQQARAVAAALGAEHVEVEFREGDFWRLLPEIARAMDDPAADYAILPTYKLAATAREAGLKVILSGEGGDELFAGYGRYRSVMRPWWAGGTLLRARGNLDKLGILRGDLAGWRDGIAAAELRAALAGGARGCRSRRRPIAPTGCPTIC